MFLSEGFLNIIQNVLMLVGILYLLFSMDWKLAAMACVFVPPIGFIATKFHRRVRPMWTKVQQTIAALGTTLQENLMGVRVVKAFSLQEAESKKFDVDAKDLYSTTVETTRQMALNMPIMTVLMSIPTAIVIWYGAHEFVAGHLTIGQITQFVLYLQMLAMPVQMMGMITNMFTRSVSAGTRILEILDTESPVKESQDAIDLTEVKGAVKFENVSFSYDSKAPALKDISFDVHPGQLVALVGGSGSGKSTIVNLISRFYDVTDGKVSIDGHDIRDLKLSSLRTHIGIAQQDVFLFTASIRDNIAYGSPNASMDEIITAAKAAQIHDFILSLPEGYNTWTGERGLTLSGGEKQRIVIARALLINPSILILDDSTSSVDAKTERLIRQALDELIKGRTTFIITHRLPIIQNADLIVVLKDGQIAEKGKHDDLINHDGIYRQIYQAQLQVSKN
jgi:ATP-binding cassette subfamily B protein